MRRPSVARLSQWRRTRAAEVAVVLLVLIAIQVGVFADYYSGRGAPIGDFFGPYNNEAYAWWAAGGLLDPPEWMPQIWGGYPSVASIQNSSWYLPTGIWAWLTDFDIRAAASLQAVHVAFGALGMYVLGRRAGFARSASLLGLVGYSFCTGFYTNAAYVDFVRGFAFAPWLLLCLSPLWPWRRWFGIPLASLLLWQALVAIYPGMLIAIFYGGAIWAIAHQVDQRLPVKKFLLPLAASAALAGCLASVKYLPLLVLKPFDGDGVPDLSAFTAASVGTLLLPAYDGLPGLATMQSFFVPATCVALALLAPLRNTTVRASLAVGTATVLIVVPQWPWHAAIEHLPAIGVSRFLVNDYRPFLLVSIVVCAMAGMTRLVTSSRSDRSPVSSIAMIAATLTVPAAAVALLVAGSYALGDWRAAMVTLAVSATLVVALILRGGTGPRARHGLTASMALLTVATVGSGVVNIASVEHLWNSDSRATQQALWGATAGQLIADAPEGEVDARQRPARVALPEGVDSIEAISPAHNGRYYDGQLGVGGYINVHGSPSFVTVRAAIDDPETSERTRALFTAPGIVIEAGGDATRLPGVDEVSACVDSGECGSALFIEPTGYEAGSLAYRAVATTTVDVLVNEAYYPGWVVIAYDDGGNAHPLEAMLGPAGTIALNLPAGTWDLELTYRTPLGAAARAIAALGLALIVVAGILPMLIRRFRSRSGLESMSGLVTAASATAEAADAPDGPRGSRHDDPSSPVVSSEVRGN